MKKLGCLLLFAFSLWFSFRPWEWGMMDDPYFHRMLWDHIARHGLIGGVLSDMAYLIHIDVQNWGFFRYSYAVYSAVLYLFPPSIAYASRLLEFYFLLWSGWLLTVRASEAPITARYAGVFTVAALAAIRSLHDGLSIVNLCEFSGVVFVGAAMLILTRQRKAKWDFICIFLSLLVAVGFKPPFVWVLFSYSAYLADRKQTTRAGATFTLSCILFFLAAYLSRHGMYSQNIYRFELTRFVSTLVRFSLHIGPSVVVFLAMISMFSIDPSKLALSLKLRSDTCWAGLILLMGGIGYLGTLLPRGVSTGLGVYLAAPVYLIVLGCFLAITPALRIRSSVRLGYMGVTIALLVATTVSIFSLMRTIRRDLTVRGVRDWLASIPTEGESFAVNSTELKFNVPEVVSLKLERPWPNLMTSLTSTDNVPAKLDYYIVFDEQAPPNPLAVGAAVARFPLATIYSTPKGEKSTSSGAQ